MPQRWSSRRTITLRRAEVLLQKFSERWPQGLEWPAGIPRPQRAAAGDLFPRRKEPA